MLPAVVVPVVVPALAPVFVPFVVPFVDPLAPFVPVVPSFVVLPLLSLLFESAGFVLSPSVGNVVPSLFWSLPLFWSPLLGKPAFVPSFCDVPGLSSVIAAAESLLPFTKATVPAIAAINRTTAMLIIIMVLLLL